LQQVEGIGEENARRIHAFLNGGGPAAQDAEGTDGSPGSTRIAGPLKNTPTS
jgi:hypothetical protein